MVSLHNLSTGNQPIDSFFFDGILEYQQQRFYVQRASFLKLFICGYGDLELDSIDGYISIQSYLAQQRVQDSFRYHLSAPSDRYKKYHETFIWIANLTKHCLDYLLIYPSITLQNFRSDFQEWIIKAHKGRPDVRQWLQQCKCLVQAVIAYEPYLWKEASRIDRRNTNLTQQLTKHKIWSEIATHIRRLNAIPAQPRVAYRTIVTPFVKDCFRKMYFSSILQAEEYSHDVEIPRARRLEELGFSPETGHFTEMPPIPIPMRKRVAVHRGDFIAVPREHKPYGRDQSQLQLGNYLGSFL
jgi:DNA (cytosine-5)-methyltransferase 1